MITPLGLPPGWYNASTLYRLCWTAAGTAAHDHAAQLVTAGDAAPTGAVAYFLGATVHTPTSSTLHFEAS